MQGAIAKNAETVTTSLGLVLELLAQAALSQMLDFLTSPAYAGSQAAISLPKSTALIRGLRPRQSGQFLRC